MKNSQKAILKAILKNPDSFRSIPIQETKKETKESEAKDKKTRVRNLNILIDTVDTLKGSQGFYGTLTKLKTELKRLIEKH